VPLVISSALLYLFVLALIATSIGLFESKSKAKIFNYIPGVVLIYATSMFISSYINFNDEINHIYRVAKSNLLPAMLFLMLLSVDLNLFFRLSKSLIIAYILATLSIGLSFVLIFYLFGFSSNESGIFASLCGSWMGGTANMLAVGSALSVSESEMGVAMIVDSIDYALWVMILLSLVKFAPKFNLFTKTSGIDLQVSELGCACHMGPKRYYLLLALALVVSLFTQLIAENFYFISKTTTTVMIATLLGLLLSQTKLRKLNGSSELSLSMLYLLVALIGSKASFISFSELSTYVLAGALILLLHAFMMVIFARLFKLDLFSIAVASLANVGGVASAPILAAAYHKSLISIGVLMAIMGYLIGTFGGIFIGSILQGIS